MSIGQISTRLGLVALSIVMFWGVGEILCRVFFPDMELRYVNDPEALFHFAPNQVGAVRLNNGFLSPPMRINQLGFRSADLSDNDVPKILVLGDSFTFGWGVADHETFAARLDQAIDGNMAVANGGQPGYGIFQMAAALRRVGPRMRPRLVVVVLWQGDFLRQPPDDRERERFLRSRSIRHFLRASVLLTQSAHAVDRLLLRYRLKRALLGAAHNNGSAGDAKTIIDAHLRGLEADKPRLVEMHKEALQYGHGLFLVLWPKEDFAPDAEAGLARHLTDALGAFARKEGIPFISVQPAMRGIPKESLLIPKDWHPTPLAHCVVAQSIAAELSRLKLETFPSMPCSLTNNVERQKVRG